MDEFESLPWKPCCACHITSTFHAGLSRITFIMCEGLYQTEKLITVVWNKCLFFSLLHTPINTRVDLPRLLSLFYSTCTVPACLVQKIYSSPTCLCASKHSTSFPSFSSAFTSMSRCLYRSVNMLLQNSPLSYRLFHAAIWFYTLSTRIELQNMGVVW